MDNLFTEDPSLPDQTDSEKESDEYSDEESVDSDEGFDGLEFTVDEQKFEDDTKLSHYDYKYCVSRDDTYVASEAVVRETQMRKLQFILMEIINDMGISKGTLFEWISTLLLAIIVFEFRMIIHYGG